MNVGDSVAIKDTSKKVKTGTITNVYPEGLFAHQTMYEVRTSPIHTGLFSEKQLTKIFVEKIS